LIVYLQFSLLISSSCFSSFVFSTWFIFASYLISNLPARTLRIFHLSPLLAHHPLDPSVSCVCHAYIKHFFHVWLFLGPLDPEDGGSMILQNVRNYSQWHSPTLKKTGILSQVTVRTSNLQIIVFI